MSQEAVLNAPCDVRGATKNSLGPWALGPGPELRVIRAGLLGYGRVGQAVAAAAERSRASLNAAGVDLRCVAALVRDLDRPRNAPSVGLTRDGGSLLAGWGPLDLGARGPMAPPDVVIEALGGVEPARALVAAALDAGIPVISANKTLVAHHGLALAALARERGVAFAYDAAVVAGVPCLGAIARRPLVAAATRIAGIINGTSHYIVTELARGATFAAALARAVELGYAEPDSAADLSGRDAAEKLTILLHLAGCHDLVVEDFSPLGLDVLDRDDLDGARALGGTIKPIALASLDPDAAGAWVGPAFVAATHAFARVSGVTNALQLAGGNGAAVTFSGPGAGPAITAATLIDDVVEALDGGVRRSTVASQRAVRASALRQPPPSAWFLRLRGLDGLRAADLAEFLAGRRLAAVQLQPIGGVWFVRTVDARWDDVRAAIAALRSLGGEVIALPALGEDADV
ncbi:MAG TPA: homoserine dehydrogenase [Vicinamibacterales bacterium]|nr:homoserine dehydrogenase [Vicinamibacterales bacterium]